MTRTPEGYGREFSNEELEAAGLEFDTPDMEEDAAERLHELPLCVEATTTFEVVLGTGRPDDRLCLPNADGGLGRPASGLVRSLLYRGQGD